MKENKSFDDDIDIMFIGENLKEKFVKEFKF